MRRYFLAFAALAIGLCGVIAVELTGLAVPAANLAPPEVVVAPPPPARAGATSNTLVAAILARPLFVPSRQPAATGAATSSDLPRVSGIIVSPAGDLVVFMPADGHPIVVGQGGRVGAYTLTAISINSITIAGPLGLRELHTTFAIGAGADPSFTNAGAATMPDWMRDVTPGQGSAVTWDGPPRVSALPIKTLNAASAPLLGAPADAQASQ